MSRALKEPEVDTYGGRCAARLRELRTAKGMKPSEVAEQLGVALSTVYNWEAGTSEPSLEMLFRLADLYDLRSPRLLLADK